MYILRKTGDNREYWLGTRVKKELGIFDFACFATGMNILYSSFLVTDLTKEKEFW
jgi:hypothetical protein